MDLLSIPKEQIEDDLFPFLHVNDILRLRRVCRSLKNVADNYLRLYGHKLLGEIIIDVVDTEEEKSFEDFMATGFSVSKINLKIDGPSALGFDGALDFIKTHGSEIKELRVNNMYCCVTQEEFQFYQALTNLVSLEIHTVDTVNKNNCRHPTSFCKTLKKLKINEVIYFPTLDIRQFPIGDEEPFRRIHEYVTRFNDLCDKTEYVNDPCYRLWGSNSNDGNFNVVQGIRGKDGNGRDETVKTYDLSGYRYSDYTYTPGIIYYASVGCRGCPRLVGVDTNYFLRMSFLTLDNLNKLGRHLQSITNVSGLMLQIEHAPYLEEIDIYSTARCSVRHAALLDNRWPNLKKFLMCVDSTTVEGGESVNTLFDQFFGGNIIHKNLEELNLSFELFYVLAEVAYVWPTVQSIISSCPNLKKLNLKGWPGTNEELCQLWGGLENLEHVCLEDCGEMGDEAFLGGERENPALLQLQKLRKLELRKVDKMPRITNAAFERVFRHTNLTHFIIQSDEPIENVTPAGIRTLLTGDFANSIAKFPFQGWSMAGVPEEAFKELGSAFRSSYMV